MSVTVSMHAERNAGFRFDHSEERRTDGGHQFCTTKFEDKENGSKLVLFFDSVDQRRVFWDQVAQSLRPLLPMDPDLQALLDEEDAIIERNKVKDK